MILEPIPEIFKIYIRVNDKALVTNLSSQALKSFDMPMTYILLSLLSRIISFRTN